MENRQNPFTITYMLKEGQEQWIKQVCKTDSAFEWDSTIGKIQDATAMNCYSGNNSTAQF